MKQHVSLPRMEVLAWAVLFIALAILPLLTDNDFYLNLMVFIYLFGGLATAWNILGGMAGQFSLGHTVFYGIGAYTSTLLYNYADVSPWLGLLVGGFLAVGIGALISYPAFRVRGVFFAMTTLAAGEVIRRVFIYSRRALNIPYGLSINYEPNWTAMIFEGRRPYVFIALAYLVVVLVVKIYFNKSHIGYYLRALRDNEDSASALGIPTRKYKLIAMAVSAFFTAVGGTLAAQYVMYIEPESVFTIQFSVELPLMAILGGMGTTAGPFTGAAIVIGLREFLQASLGNAASGLYLLIYGSLLMLIALFLPQGLLGGLLQVGQLERSRRITSLSGAQRGAGSDA